MYIYINWLTQAPCSIHMTLNNTSCNSTSKPNNVSKLLNFNSRGTLVVQPSPIQWLYIAGICGILIVTVHHSLHVSYSKVYMYESFMYYFDHMWPGLRTLTIWVQKNCGFLACLLHHNLINIYTTATKSSSLLQSFMGFLVQLTEMG